MRRGILLVFLLLAGCPDSNKTGGDTAVVDSSVRMSGKIQKKPGTAKPVEAKKPEDPFPREKLIELYRADMRGDLSVQKKYGLIDDEGKPVSAKQDEFDQALKRFAEVHADEFTKLVDELEAARVTSASAADVGKK